MREFYPLLITGAFIIVFASAFIVAYALIKDKKKEIGFDRNMKDSEILRRLLPYAKPYLKNYIAVLAVLIFSIAYDILSPLFIGYIEEMIVGDFAMKTLIKYVIGYAGLLIVSVVGVFVQQLLLQKTGQKILSAIREDLFDHIENLSHDQLTKIPVGKLVTRECNDTEAISLMFTSIAASFAKNILVIVGVFGAMLMLNYELTLMVMCFVPFVVLFTMIFRKFSRRAYRKVKDRTTDLNTFLSENLSGIKIIQIFNNEERKLREFKEKNDKLTRARNREIMVFSVFRPTVYMLYITSVMCLFYLCARGTIKGTTFLGQTITGGTLVSFYMYISRFFTPIQTLAEMFNRLQSAMASAEKVFTILDIEPDIKDEPDAIELEEMRGEIEFKDVWFTYTGEKYILRGVSFHVMPGETVAFVGATGAGKTTILSLLCRNYDIQKGQILIDGIDIKHIRIGSLRRHFGQMLQDVFLFSGDVRSNIVLGNDSYTDEEVMEACRYINAEGLVNRLPNGLKEEVRERGNNFSAGERQLLSFARTVIHKPSVMILDEATANIDTETEILIQNSLEKLMNIGTMLMVAHRLSTIQHADKIIVINHGEIVEQGNHFELLEKQGAYYELYKIQEEAENMKNK